jgi:ATP-dependent Clp protease ATP-binding subunit ClpC
MPNQNQENILHKFTSHFKQVLLKAQNLAVNKKQEFIEPTDLLLALATTKGSLGSDILIKQQIDPLFLNQNALNQTPPISNINPADLPQPSDNSQAIIAKAVVTAYKFQHKYIGTEHLLWGLTESGDGEVKQAMVEAKIDLTGLKQHLSLILKSTSKFSDLAAEEDLKEIENLMEAPASPDNGPLENFTINLTSEEIQKDIDPVIGRVREIDLLIEILSRRTKNNPVLLGDAGVGKTAIIEGLAKRITENKVPDVLLNKTILNLDLASLIAGTMYRGEFENRLKNIIKEIKNNSNIILFIDELHTIMGAGATAGSLDAANILKPALSRGQLRCIGATTFEEYKKHIESDRALERRFQPIIVNEPSDQETYEILRGLRQNYEKFHRVTLTDGALKAAVDLSRRFLPDKKMPDKALDLIDQAAARLKVKNTKDSQAKRIKILQTEIEALANQKRQAVLEEKYSQALEFKNQEEKYLEELLRLKATEDKKKNTKLGLVDAEQVKEIISNMTGIPLTALDSDESKRLLNLEKKLSQRIFGQDKALETIAHTIRKSKTGLQNKNRPLASFMFLGPSGVGKTETAKQLAQQIFGGKENMIRIDMSEFSEKFNISKLIGAPAGYVGYKEGNKFTDLVKNRPYSLVLFDEIEKAHADVFNLLLPILEEGELTDATGRTVNFRNCVIAMTTNIGLDKFNQTASLGFKTEEDSGDFSKISQDVLGSLSNYFPPEFINRLDNLIVFEPLSKNAARKVVQQEIANLTEKLKEQNIILEIDNKIINYLLQNKEASQEGARSLKRLVDKHLSNPLAALLLSQPQEKFSISLLDEKIVIK